MTTYITPSLFNKTADDTGESTGKISGQKMVIELINEKRGTHYIIVINWLPSTIECELRNKKLLNELGLLKSVCSNYDTQIKSVQAQLVGMYK